MSTKLTPDSAKLAREVFRNRIARELSWKLKRMPTEYEVEKEMMEQIAIAFAEAPDNWHPAYPGEDVDKSDLTAQGYLDYENITND